jgi:hypothetical protein
MEVGGVVAISQFGSYGGSFADCVAADGYVHGGSSGGGQGVLNFDGLGLGNRPSLFERVAGIDCLRGAAICLMILDHVLALYGRVPGYFVRESVTRGALPAFMVVAGWLWAFRGVGPSVRRMGVILGVGLLSDVLFGWAHLNSPEIFQLYFFVALISGFVLFCPAVCLVVGVLQVVNWPVPLPGYPFGEVLAFISLGVLLYRAGWRPEVRNRFLEYVGAYPVTFYLGHIVFLGAAGWLINRN